MFNSEINIMRGDVVWYEVKTNKPSGNIQHGRRPGVILQNNIGNLMSPTVIIAPLTAKIKKQYMPTHVILETSCLKIRSMVLLEQITTINKTDICEKVGALTVHQMELIDNANLKSLGINTSSIKQKDAINPQLLLDKNVENKENKEMTKSTTETKTLTKEERILKMLEEGMLVKDIKQKLKVSSNTVTQIKKKWCEKNGKKVSTRLTPNESLQIYLMLMRGESYQSIIDIFNITEQSALNYGWRLKNKPNIDIIQEARAILEKEKETLKMAQDAFFVKPQDSQAIDTETLNTEEYKDDSIDNIAETESVVLESTQTEDFAMTTKEEAQPAQEEISIVCEENKESQLNCFSLLKPKTLLLNGAGKEYSIEDNVIIHFKAMNETGGVILNTENLDIFIEELQEIKKLKSNFGF